MTVLDDSTRLAITAKASVARAEAPPLIVDAGAPAAVVAIAVDAGVELAVKAAASKKKGTLRLAVAPWAKVVIDGTPEKQLAYYEKLLALAQQRRFAFVISFVHQDYDALWERIKDSSPELFIAWRDCGLVDERGTPRPAFAVWKAYLGLPRKD